MSSTSASTPALAQSWTEGLPEPRSSPRGISADELAEIIKNEVKVIGKDYIVVDVRRTDFEMYAIPGAINLPADSFYATRVGVRAVLAHIPLVIFHCQFCKPGSRGQKVAAYYQDALEDADLTTTVADTNVKVVYLEGGIRGWAEKFKDTDLTVRL